MVKEMEKEGLPTAHITNMTPVAKVTGSNRIIAGNAINHPCSDIDLPINQQLKMRKDFIVRALKAVSTDVKEATFF